MLHFWLLPTSRQRAMATLMASHQKMPLSNLGTYNLTWTSSSLFTSSTLWPLSLGRHNHSTQFPQFSFSHSLIPHQVNQWWDSDRLMPSKSKIALSYLIHHLLRNEEEIPPTSKYQISDSIFSFLALCPLTILGVSISTKISSYGLSLPLSLQPIHLYFYSAKDDAIANPSAVVHKILWSFQTEQPKLTSEVYCSSEHRIDKMKELEEVEMKMKTIQV